MNILVWLPSPIGDAVLCTPALRAIRKQFKSGKISFLARPIVRELLSPGSFNDKWLEQENKNPFAIAKMLRGHNFTHAILFKNSFASALTAFLAKIPLRIGYAREGRGFLLTEKLYPPKSSNIKFKPVSMLDYYLAIASLLGADTTDRKPEIPIDPEADKSMQTKLLEVADGKKPIVVIVPGGAFGPSKYWPAERFAQTADRLIAGYNATVIISVAPDEKQIAKKIGDLSKYKLINSAEKNMNFGELKSLFAIADLVISNDTGPRHIAIALNRKIISLFGPNNPVWTETGYENEIQIVGQAPCAPCGRPICKKPEHFCMQSITVEMVCEAAKKLLENHRDCPERSRRGTKAAQNSKSFFIDPDYKTAFDKFGLTSIDAVFSLDAGKNLTKKNLAKHRSRIQFEIESPPTTLFLKRYDRPPILVQLKNWLSCRKRKSMSSFDFAPADELAAAGINTPKTISHGEQWGAIFEKRSFVITEKIPNAESLERKLPGCFYLEPTTENLKLQRNFIAQLAGFVKKFHETGFRHRDLYLCHIFYDNNGKFYLIDLARAFKPTLLAERFKIKDITQIYYSAPAKYFSRTDRLRFYHKYTGCNKLTRKDKVFIRKVAKKAGQMAKHDKKHGRDVPFSS